MTQMDLFDQQNSVLRQKTLDEIYQEIAQIYLSNNLPWVVGFSGGKDSTATLQLVWYALKTLPPDQRTKHVYVVASDTLVEAPAIAERIDSSLQQMNVTAQDEELPLSAHKVTPEVDESFWVNLIGRGYPAPYARFRWCTERMKIKPTNRFIMDRVTEHGEVVVVLGVRRLESATREQAINLHKITGSRLARHTNLPGAYVYTPIEDFTLKDVWDYLFLVPNPWGIDNLYLQELYESAQGECPLVIDTLTPSCGNTRFGCWVCTVVEKDRSMEAMTESGDAWLQPMLDFRDYLVSTQDPANKPDQRSAVRRDGRVWIKEGKHIWGPYKLQFRKELLRRLLQAQAEVQRNGPDPDRFLIQPEELHAIRRVWRSEEGDWTDDLPRIYREETGDSLNWIQDDTGIFGTREANLLEGLCGLHNVSAKLVKLLLDIELEYDGMRRRHEIFQKIDQTLKRDWRNEEEISAYIAQATRSYRQDR